MNLAPIAALSGLANAAPLLGENVSYSFSFQNTSPTDTGYSPFFDLIVDTSGPDGTTNLPPSSLNPTSPANAADGYVGSSGATVPTVGVSGLALQPVGSPVVLTAGQTTYVNPFTGQTLGVPAGYGAGDTIYTFQMPFGSFTPGQNTAVSVSLPTSQLADVGTALPVTVRPGFRDTDGNPNAPLVPTPAGTHLDASASATPMLYTFNKTYLGPENETATGPNFVRRYRLSVDIATGQTISALQLTDDLGPTMQLVGLTSANMAAFLAPSLGTNVLNPVNRTGTATATAPDGTVVYTFGSVTGVAGTDAVFEFDFFVPRDNSAANEILPQPTPPGPNPAGGTDSILDTNTASSAGTWNPLDSRDPQNQNVSKAGPDNGPHTLQEHSVAVQKSVAIVSIGSPNTPTGGTVIPGQSLLRYTINFQVSDYYAVNDLLLEDVLGDGQRLYLAPGFSPTLSVQNPYTYSGGGTRAATSSGAFGGVNTIDFERRYTVTGDTDSDPSAGTEGYAAAGPSGGVFSAPTTGAIDGTTFLRFNISDELIARGLPGILVGGEIANGGGNPQNLVTPPFGPAQGTIVFWVIAKREYSDNFPSGDNSVDQGDTLANSVPLIQGSHLNPNDLADGTPTQLGTTGTDNSGTSVTIANGGQSKTVYAINDATIPTQTVGDTVFSVQAGDRITYKLTYTLPVSRFESLSILDIPPLPLMPVGPAGQYTFDATFDGSFTPYEIEVAPDDTFFSTFGAPAPTISTNPTTNTLQFDFGNFDDPLSQSTTISLLVTFPVGPDTFVGDLFLTNQLRVNEGNTFLGTTSVEDLRRIQLVRPVVTIDKGIVGYGTTGRTLGGIGFTAPNNPPTAASVPSFSGTIDTSTEADAVGGANIAASDNADASDRVRYAIVAQNTGRGDAYDVVIEDQVQTGYDIPATFAGLNLNIRRGDGTLLSNFAEVQAFARVATTAALTGTGLAFDSGTGGGQFTNIDRTLDTLVLNTNDLVLVKNQATASENGVYRVTAVDLATNRVTLTRDVGFDTAVELSSSFVAIMGGTSANRYFQAGAVATLNTSAVNYTLQATTQDYYAIYNNVTGAFRLLLSDNYAAGNVSPPGEVPDTRGGSLSRRESTPLVSGSTTPAVTLVTNGSNSVVVQYDLILSANVAPNQSIVNTAAVTNLGTGEGGVDATDPTLVSGALPITDIATAIVRLPQNTKTLFGTEVTEAGNAALDQAVIGELVTYDIVLTIPEGVTPGANIFDRLDHGLAFSSIESVTLSSSALSTSTGITFANNGVTNATTLAGSTAFSGANSRDITFTFGDISNTNADNTVPETITIRYRTVVLNSNSLTGDLDGNQAGDQRNNQARFRWTNNATTLSQVSANNITIVEPALTTTKDVAVQPAGGGPFGAFGQSVRADAGDDIQYRITIANGAAATVLVPTGSTTAFDVSLSDALPTANFSGGVAAFSIFSVSQSGTGNVRRNGVNHTLLPAVDFEITAGGVLRFNPGFRYDIEPSVTVQVVVEGVNFIGATGQFVTNSADVRWTSMEQNPGNRAGNGQTIGVERTGVNGEGSGLDNYADADDAVIESPVVVRKTLVSTSEASTSDANPAVGEIARFRLAASVPEGTTRNFQIQDVLPAGLAFLNDGTARFAFVSTGGGVISSAGITNVTGLGTPVIGTGGINGNEATLAALLSTNIIGTFNDDNVAPGSTGAGTLEGAYGNGDDVFFRFGDVNNTDNDVDYEYVVIEFNALVLNVVGNQAGTALDNRMTVLADTNNDGTAGFIDIVNDTNGDGTGTGEATIAAIDPGNNAAGTSALSAAVTLTVVEPSIALTKTVLSPSPAAGDPGDTITFEITFTNTAGANSTTAFDVVLTDTVPSSFENVAYVGGSLSSSGTVTGLPGSPTILGTGISLALDSIAPGGSVTFRITATINDNGVSAPAPGSTITNTAEVTATSLPGDRGTGGSWTGDAGTSSALPGTPGSGTGDPGTSTGERTGADGEGGALNDYADSDPADVTLNSHQVGGLLYHDANNNGSRDLGESLITVSTTFRLTGTDVAGNAVSIDVTTATGAYNFGSLRAGTYTITQLGQPTGYLDGRDTAGTSSPGAAFGGTGTLATDDRGTPATPLRDADAVTSIVIVGGNQSKTGINYNFGEVQPASLGNLVFIDSNGNGRQDGGTEVGINGVGVTINGTDDTGRAVTVNTTTAGGGLYQFSNLRPGVYTVTFGNSDGVTTYTRTVQDSAVATDATDSDGNVATGTTGNYTIASGDSNQTVDQGLYIPVSLGNRVFFDNDADGVQDSGEPGIPGAGVQVIWLGPDAAFGGGDDQTFNTTTGVDGIWSVGNLPPGSYRVTATPPGGAGWTLTDSIDNGGAASATNPVTVSTTSGVDCTDIDFGFRGTASLGDRVFLDQDSDGIQDAGEQGLPGVTVTLRYDANNDGDYTDADDGLFTTVTNSSGNYLFANLPAGNYQVSVGTPGTGGVPDNTTLTDSLDNGVLNAVAAPTVTLTTGQTRTEVDFGFVGTASIGDLVWYDADGNGTQGAGEPGIPGATVTLLWSGPDGAFGGGDDVAFTTTTDASGNYLFPSLPVNGASDPYRVTVTRPANFPAQTYDATAPLTDDISTLDLGQTENNVLQDFGYRGTASLGDQVWNDLDGNGRFDAGEPGINGVSIQLFYAGADGVFQAGELAAPLLSTTTAGGGLYQFANLAAGTYRVTFGNTVGATTYTRTVLDSVVATDATDSDGNVATGATGNYTLANGASDQTVDQGLFIPVSLGNRVFFDMDTDGVQDSGEPGIPGATVQVIWLGPDATFGGGDDQTFSTTTGADGIWSIGNLPPGSYQVTATPPSGQGWTVTDSIDNGGAASATNPVTVSTTSGVDRTDVDFGYRGTASLGDRVYLDQDSDGVQDAGEPGLPSVTVTLRYDANNDGDYTDADDGLFTTVTNASGNYVFANLPAGNYQVSVPAAGTGGVPDNTTLTDSLDNGVLSATSAPTLTLTTGQTRTDADFGFVGTASIGDRIWYDADGNGTQGAGEPGIPGVTVTLLWSGPNGAFGGGDDVTFTTTTDANGDYLFPSLPVNGASDPYRVTVTRPASFPAQTYDATAPLTDDISTLNLGPTENNVLQDFGYRGTASLGNLVFLDANGNGRQDGGTEVGINGVSVQIFYAGADGVFQPAELATPLLSTTTAGGGLYQFANLAAGTYRVTFGNTVGATTYTRTVLDSAVATDATDSDGNVATGATGNYTLANGASDQTVDQGLFIPVSLGNRVFFDMDTDGVQDSGEPGIPGATVQVIWLGPDATFGGGDDQTFSTTTGADGIWSIGNLPPGSYRVTATPPGGAGWTLTDSIDNGGAASATNPVTVSTTSGNDRVDIDFGFRGTASLGDRVYLDQDGDGVQDVGEQGLPSVTVTLRYDANNDGDYTDADDGLFTTVTNGSGNYLFANLPAGNYQVSVPTPGAGGVPDNTTLTDSLDNGVLSATSAPTVTLTTGQTRTDADFGFVGMASIGDRIWYDADGNGTQGAGEPGIPGVTVTLLWSGPNGAFGGGDDVTFTTTTDATGDYLFPSLPVNGASDPYRVTVTRPANFPTQTYDATPVVTDDISTLNLGQTENNVLQDFGYRGTATLGNQVWNDLNGNGRFDAGEPGIDGVSVQLFYAGADGVFQVGEFTTPLLSTVTAGGGLYQFPNLAAGTYRVRFGATVGATTYTRTVLDSAVATDATDSDANVTTGGTANYTLTNGEGNQTVDQGLFIPVSLGNRVFFDFDGDGVQDSGEPGIPGTAIEVTWLGPDASIGGGDDQTFNTTTGADGIWSVNNLPPGSYSVTATPPIAAAWTITDSIDNGGAASATNPVTVSTTSGINRTDIDFGFRGLTPGPLAPASIGDRVYVDADLDGVQDPSEPGLPGVTVTLRYDANNDGDYTDATDGLFTTVTNASGTYGFTNLPAGNYQVSVPAAGSGGVPDNTTLTDSLDNGVLNANPSPTVTLLPLQTRTDVDFGFRGTLTAAVGDRVWYDADGNGTQGAGEPGVPGATVTLLWSGPNGAFGGGDDVTFTTTTDANGNYLFVNLPVNGASDPYRVTVTRPASFPAQTYDATPVLTDDTSTLNLSPGSTNLLQDFGYRGTATLGNQVWNDLNGNGRFDGGEPGINGVSVQLFYAGADGIFQPGELVTPLLSTTTAGGGLYQFPNLAAGTYRVQFGNTVGATTYTRTATDVIGVGWTDSNDSDANVATGVTGSYVLANGSSNQTVDQGLYVPVSIGNRVFFDIDADGVQDSNEPGIQGANIQVTWLGPDGVFGGGDDQTFNTTTGANGIWNVSNLPPGSYRVTATPPAGPGWSIADSIDNGGAASTVNPVTVSTTSGVNRSDIDFGFRGTGSLGDRVYFDQDSDGVQDAGEQGLSGITVTLLWSGFDGAFGGGDDITLTTVTNGSGNYLFPNLPAGTYQVSVPGPATGGVSGDFVLIDSIDNGTLSPNASPTVTLAAGQNRTDVDFGFGNAGLIIGADLGCNYGALVRVVDPGNGSIRGERYVYEPSFRGGVRVYGADITGDGIPEILTAPGSGRPGEVRVFDRNLNPLPQFNFFPFGTNYKGGIEIAAGSMTAPGVFEIVAAQSSSTSLVRVFRVNSSSVNTTPIRQFQPFAKNFAGGVTVATADVGTFVGGNASSASPDGVSEIIVGSKAGIPAAVRVYNARPTTPALIGAFRAMGGSTRGVSVARMPGASGAADQILVAGGPRNAGQVENWARVGSGFARVASFAAFGGTAAAVSTCAINSSNIFTVEGVGGQTAGIRKHISPSSSVASEVPQTSTLVPAWRVAVLRR